MKQAGYNWYNEKQKEEEEKEEGLNFMIFFFFSVGGVVSFDKLNLTHIFHFL